MKKLSHKNLRSLLLIALVAVMLAGILGGCFSKDKVDETVNNLPDISTDPSDSTEESTEESTEAPTDPPVETTKGTVTTDNLNIRSSPSTDSTVITQLAAGTVVEITETKTIDGVNWGRIEEGWINLNYVDIEGDENDNPTDPVDTTDPTEPSANTGSDNTTSTTGYITASSLNIRKGAGTTYDSVGKYSKGDKVTILETKDGWGRTDKGWVSMKYVSSTAPSDTDDDNTGSTGTATSGSTGTINTGALNIREGAGSKYDSVGKYYKGDKVTILETKNGWGRTDKGWISLKYVDVTGSASSSGSNSSTSSEVVSDGKTTSLGNGVVTIGTLNVRCGPGTDYDKVDTVSAGERRSYYQKSGSWVRIKEGWVSTKYFYIEGTTGEGAGSGTITGDQLNVRTGPGTGFTSNGKLNKGDKVEILAQVTVGDSTWGYTKSGWVSMKYVEMAS